MLEQPSMRGNGLPWFEVLSTRLYSFIKEMLTLSFGADCIVHVRGTGIGDLGSLSLLFLIRDSTSASTVPSTFLQH